MLRFAALILSVLVVLGLAPGAPSKANPTPQKSKAPAKKTSTAKRSAKKSAAVRTARKAAPKSKTKRVAAKKRTSKKTIRRASLRRKVVRPKIVIQEPAVTGLQCALGATAPGAATACANCSEQALVLAHSLVGLRYKRGGNSVETGFDCSGFVRHVFETSCQLNMPRSASAQYQVGMDVSRAELLRGDLVFFRSRRGWHVGIYTGDGDFIHSPNRRDSVKVSSLTSPYYRRTYLGARRLTHDITEPLPAEVPTESEVLSTDAGLN